MNKATLSGQFFIRDKDSEREYEGPKFSITLEEDLREEYIEQDIMEILRAHISYKNNYDFLSDKDSWRFELDKELALDKEKKPSRVFFWQTARADKKEVV